MKKSLKLLILGFSLVIISFLFQNSKIGERQIDLVEIAADSGKVILSDNGVLFKETVNNPRGYWGKADLIFSQQYFIKLKVKKLKPENPLDIQIGVYPSNHFDNPNINLSYSIKENITEAEIRKTINGDLLSNSFPTVRVYSSSPDSFVIKELKIFQYNSFYYLFKFFLPCLGILFMTLPIYRYLRRKTSIIPDFGKFVTCSVLAMILSVGFVILPDMSFLWKEVNRGEYHLQNAIKTDSNEFQFAQGPGVKVIYLPISVKSNQDYIINYEVEDNNESVALVTDFYAGAGYDFANVEFRNYITSSDVPLRISKFINSSEIPKGLDQAVQLRIFTDSEASVKIKNINIYKLTPLFFIFFYIIPILIGLTILYILYLAKQNSYFQTQRHLKEWLYQASLLSGGLFFISISLILILNCLLLIFGKQISWITIPFALFINAIIIFAIRHEFPKLNIRSYLFILPLVCLFGFIGYSAAGFYFDTSADGQSYHQEAVYYLKNGWNPFKTLELPENTVQAQWITHYPKAQWIVAATIYDATNYIEYGKLINFIVLCASCLLVFAVLLSLNINTLLSAIIALLVSFNPVIISQLFTYYNDGLGFSYMLAFIALFVLMVRNNSTYILITITAIILFLVNIKFTTFVYAGILAMFFTLFFFFRKQIKIGKTLLVNLGISFILAVSLIGYAPYIQNYTDHGHPFHPLMGEKKVEILRASGSIPNAFIGKDFTENFVRSYFSESQTIGNNNFKFPLIFSINEFNIFQIPDVRIGGFGPLFSALLILSILLFIYSSKHLTKSAFFFSLFISLVILVSVLVNPASWWARYVPQLWTIPFILLVTVLTGKVNKAQKTIAFLVILFAFINAAYLTKYMLQNRWNETKLIQSQIDLMKESGKEYKGAIPYRAYRFRFEDLNIRFTEYNNITEVPCSTGKWMFFNQVLICE